MDVYESLFVQYFYVTEDDITQLTSPTPGGPNFPGCPIARTQMTRGRDWGGDGRSKGKYYHFHPPHPNLTLPDSLSFWSGSERTKTNPRRRKLVVRGVGRLSLMFGPPTGRRRPRWQETIRDRANIAIYGKISPPPSPSGSGVVTAWWRSDRRERYLSVCYILADLTAGHVRGLAHTHIHDTWKRFFCGGGEEAPLVKEAVKQSIQLFSIFGPHASNNDEYEAF